jgi:hypothetical protein
MKKDEMGRECGMQWEKLNSWGVLVGKLEIKKPSGKCRIVLK